MRSWTERRLECRAAGVILVVIVVLTGTIGGCGLVDRLLGGQQGEPYTADPSDFEGYEPAFVDLHGIDRLVLKVEAPDEDGRSYIAELRARESSTDYYGRASFLGPFRDYIPYVIDLFAMEELGAGLAILCVELDTEPPADQTDWMPVRTYVMDRDSGRLIHLNYGTYPLPDVQYSLWTEREQAIRETFAVAGEGVIYFGYGGAGNIESIIRADLDWVTGTVEFEPLVDQVDRISSFSADSAGNLVYIENDSSAGDLLRYRTAEGSYGTLTNQLPENHDSERVFTDRSGTIFVASRDAAGFDQTLSIVNFESASPSLLAPAVPVPADANFRNCPYFYTHQGVVFPSGSVATVVSGDTVSTVSWSNGGDTAVVLKNERYVFGTRSTSGSDGIAFVADIQTGWSQRFGLAGDMYDLVEMRDLAAYYTDEVFLITTDDYLGDICFYHLRTNGSLQYYSGDNDGERYVKGLDVP